MVAEFPLPGQVIEYHYLWKWQAERGETEGRKHRPCCIVLVVRNQAQNHVLFIAPITSKEPTPDRQAIVIPETEARRANLDRGLRLWVVVDELNADVLENSYTLDERTPRGRFSPAFTNQIIRAVQALRNRNALGVAKRT